MSVQTNTENVAGGSRTKRSWIWQHFKEEEIENNGIMIGIIKCQEKNDDGNPCKVFYKNSGSSTGNAIYHLRTSHNLTNNEVNKINKVVKINKVSLNIYLFKII